MKRIISFEKKLEFPSMVGEITSISLEHTLQFINSSSIEGSFLISGTYKLTEASCIEDKFEFKIPTEILLNEHLDTTTTKIEIDDFYYEIENDENLICYIDVLVEGVEEIEINEESVQELPQLQEIEIPQKEESRECDGDSYQEDNNIKEDVIETTQEEIIEELLEENDMKQEENNLKEETPSLFSSLRDDEDTFATYSVYILRQDETLQTILDKYKVTKEDLEDYNDLSTITIGSKIIIPLHE